MMKVYEDKKTEISTSQQQGKRAVNLPVASKTTHLTKHSKSKMTKQVEKSNKRIRELIANH